MWNNKNLHLKGNISVWIKCMRSRRWWNNSTNTFLTKRGNKVFMGTQGLHAALVLVVPDPNGFIISTAHYESSSRMHQYTTHPVVMPHLKKQDWLPTAPLIHKQQHWLSHWDSDRNLHLSHPTTHQSHKADANADVPHLNCFISGSRQKEGTWLSTLLTLQNKTHRRYVHWIWKTMQFAIKRCLLNGVKWQLICYDK